MFERRENCFRPFGLISTSTHLRSNRGVGGVGRGATMKQQLLRRTLDPSCPVPVRLQQRSRQFTTLQALPNCLDRHDVVPVGAVGPVVGKSGHAARCPRHARNTVVILHRVGQLHTVHGEGHLEVTVNRSTDGRNLAVVAVETRDGQNVRVARLVAHRDGVLGIDRPVEARQDEAVLPVPRHVEVDHVPQPRAVGGAAANRYLVENGQNVARSLRQDDRAVAVVLNREAGRAAERERTAKHTHDFDQLRQLVGHVAHEPTGVLRSTDQAEVRTREVQEHAVPTVESPGLVLVAADVNRSATQLRRVHVRTGAVDDGRFCGDAHKAPLPSDVLAGWICCSLYRHYTIIAYLLVSVTINRGGVIFESRGKSNPNNRDGHSANKKRQYDNSRIYLYYFLVVTPRGVEPLIFRMRT
jgi:hypothetical protein